MTSPLNRFEGVLPILSLIILELKMFYRFANRSARFIFAYREGLSGAQAAWANKKYHGHRILPPDMVALVKATVPK
jgi:hypothetical protein